MNAGEIFILSHILLGTLYPIGYIKTSSRLNSNNKNNDGTMEYDIIQQEFMKGKNRGPEHSILETKYLQMILGFHRLAINGLNEGSNQPLVFNNVVLICNGEIYNYKKLYKQIVSKPVSDSDCEVIIHLYIKYGIEQTLIMLDGVYSFVLYDIIVFLLLDRFGVVL
jgi:asparagine synthase (glutamine-hydrolysing)